MLDPREAVEGQVGLVNDQVPSFDRPLVEAVALHRCFPLLKRFLACRYAPFSSGDGVDGALEGSEERVEAASEPMRIEVGIEGVVPFRMRVIEAAVGIRHGAAHESSIP